MHCIYTCYYEKNPSVNQIAIPTDVVWFTGPGIAVWFHHSNFLFVHIILILLGFILSLENLQDCIRVTCDRTDSTLSECNTESTIDSDSHPATVICDECQEGDIRLVSLPYQLKNHYNQGFQLVEVCERGEWALSCTRFWYHEAAVVCRQLGLPYLGIYIIIILYQFATCIL